MMLKDLFSKRTDIIINTDIDGFLSGMILQKYFGCKVVGFSNSWDCVWIDPDFERTTSDALKDAIYIDLYVANPDVYCIDQHIIGYDDAHNARIASMQTKINPNIMRHGRSFKGDYFHKYPFGTVHFLIALMEREGIHVALPSLQSMSTPRTQTYQLTVGDILLRADDALFSSLGKYKANAIEWWPWLLQLSGNAGSVQSMITYIQQTDPTTNFAVKDRTGKYFMNEFGCSGTDGAFRNIADASGNLWRNVLAYRDEVCGLMNMSLNLPVKYIKHQGYASTEQYTGTGKELDTRFCPALYSYAFIYGPRSPHNNITNTLNMK